MRALILLSVLCGCGEDPGDEAVTALELRVDGEGGTIAGATGTDFEGLRLSIPAGALTEAIDLRITRFAPERDFPEGGFAVGPIFKIAPAMDLTVPATLRLPFEPEEVARREAELRGVKVWYSAPEGWVLLDGAVQATTVTADLRALGAVSAGVQLSAE